MSLASLLPPRGRKPRAFDVDSDNLTLMTSMTWTRDGTGTTTRQPLDLRGHGTSSGRGEYFIVHFLGESARIAATTDDNRPAS